MAGLVPINRLNNNLTWTGTGFGNIYNMLDDFFNGGFRPNRNLLKDTFKIDIEEKDNEYLIAAEMPGIKKEEIELNVDNKDLCISVNRSEEVNNDNKSFIHRERRVSSMSRRVRLADAKLEDVEAKLEDGVLVVSVPKEIKTSASRKINIE